MDLNTDYEGHVYQYGHDELQDSNDEDDDEDVDEVGDDDKYDDCNIGIED